MSNLFFILLTVIVSLIYADILEEGDRCINEFDGSQGKCLRFGDCKHAVIEVRTGQRPQICSFIGNISVVCCSRDDREHLKETILTKFAPSPLSVVGCSPPSERTEIKSQTGSKSRDYCIDLVKTILRCKHALENCPREDRFYINVIGGSPAYVNEFPHMALLGYGQRVETASWECGGSLISNRWVMTAAHCVYSRSAGSDVKYVRLGIHKLNEPIIRSKLFNVALTVEHPEWKPPQRYNDIALLQLDREVILSTSMIPACLHFGHENINNGVVSGWGVTQWNGKQSKDLQQATLQQIPHEECIIPYPRSAVIPLGIQNHSQVCYGSRVPMKDACQGDSGGPIQIANDEDCMYTIFGIVSGGKGCGISGIPGIYTRVSAYIPWIESVVWS